MRYLFLLLFLVGCATNTSFDNVEASRYSDVQHAAIRLSQQCHAISKLEVEQLQVVVEKAQIYSSIKANNEVIIAGAALLQEQASDLVKRYATTKPSHAYCTLKILQISNTAKLLAISISKKEK